MTTLSHSLSALAAGALLLSAAGGTQAQTPYGAYSSQTNMPASCRNVQQLQNGYVSAECQTSGGWRWSALRPADCRSAISSRDGVLTCTGARATVGEIYPDNSYGGQPTGQTQAAPGGIIGALLGAVFGDSFGNDRQIENDYNQGRRPLYERRADLDARIDAGVRDGSLSRNEATQLRADYNALVQLETRYAADGRITTQESNDLRNRYQALSQRVGDARYDGGYDNWRPLAESRASFNQRLEAGVRNRTLTRAQATRLTSDFNGLVRLETDYNRNGLDARERQDLEARWADLNRRVGDNWRPDGGYDGGYDTGYGQDGRAVALEARITANERNGRISRAEAARLREELRDLSRRWMDLEARVEVRR
jgi:hypothetical protein